MKKRIVLCAAIIISVVFIAAGTTVQRPASWANPVNLEGVTNLYKVSPELYRSAQPTAEGFKNLKNLGIKTVVNLRAFHTDATLLRDTGLNYEHIYMKTWHPEEEDVVRFLKIVTDPAKTPVLIHCQHGADRTGAMSAIYRAAMQNWSKEAAVKEMTEGGFGFHEIWANLPVWINKLDIDKIRKEAGIISQLRL